MANISKSKLRRIYDRAARQVEERWTRGAWAMDQHQHESGQRTRTWSPQFGVNGEKIRPGYNDDGRYSGLKEMVGSNTCVTCLEGAIYLAAVQEGVEDIDVILTEAIAPLGCELTGDEFGIPAYNDDHRPGSGPKIAAEVRAAVPKILDRKELEGC
jgi:hypothetical protein